MLYNLQVPQGQYSVPAMPATLMGGWPAGWAPMRAQRWYYIVYGNQIGRGGHTSLANHHPLPTVNGRAKTYFPWIGAELASAIKQVAISPDEPPIAQGPLVRLHYGTINGVRILVIITRPSTTDAWEVWNAYPKAG